MTGVKTKIARAFLDAALSLDPSVVEEAARPRISDAVVRAVSAAMDMAGINHCRKCPQRRGLTKVGDDLLCQVHKKTTEA